MTTFSVTEARAKLPAIIDMVIDGQQVEITRHGKPVAVLIDPVSLRHRRLTPAMRQAAGLRDLLERARERRDEPLIPLPEGRAEELVAAIRADRDAE